MDKQQKRILIVEDDRDYLHSLTDGLSLFNYEISTAGDGEEAITLILDEKPDLVLLDLMLPKLDGFKVLDRIRHYPDAKIAATKVVVLSNLWSNKDILRAQALKIDAYYVKANTNLQEVFEKVKTILQGFPQA
jgi:DNA-binding response OmpR family regulator